MTTVTECCKSISDCLQVSSNSHHNSQYLDVITTFTNFNSFATSSKTIFLVLCSKQFNKSNLQDSRNMELVNNNLIL